MREENSMYEDDVFVLEERRKNTEEANAIIDGYADSYETMDTRNLIDYPLSCCVL